MTRAGLALIARALALAALVLAWVAPALWPPLEPPATIYLLDVSASMPPGSLAGRWHPASGASTLAFGANAVWVDGPDTRDLARARERVDANGTDVAAAIAAALGHIDPARPNLFVVLSDAWATRGDTRGALDAARRAGVRVVWENPAPPPLVPWIRSVQVAPRAAIGVPLPVTVELAGPLAGADFELEARLGTPDTVTPGASQRVPLHGTLASLSLTPAQAGRLPLELRLLRRSTGAVLERRSPAALLEVAGPGTLLYAGHGDAPLLRSLRAAGWVVEEAPVDALERRSALESYQAIVLDDVPVEQSDAPFWRSLELAVRERGTGLLVLGGPRSFGGGAWRGTRLEGLLPVTAQQGRPEDGASVMFALDTSGSMESAVRGVDRLAYAREAALGTLRALPAGDRAAVLGFDVAAHPLIRFDAAERVAGEVESRWTLRAAGGTRLGPALREALAELGAERSPHRLLVIVTDGYIGEENLDAQIAALGRAQVDVMAIAIGSDAQLGGLEALLRPLHGQVLRVAEAGELPRLMRAAVAARRAPIARGPFAVRATQPLEFLDVPQWPAVDAYAVTRARAPGLVRLESSRGDPLLALQRVGEGRVAALPAGLGAWSAQWVAWREWPAFTGALLQWLHRAPEDPRLAVRLADRAGELVLEVDATDGANWARGAAPEVDLLTPEGRELHPRLEERGPGHFEGRAAAGAAGLYRVAVHRGDATSLREHLRLGTEELANRGVNPGLADWQREGLVEPWPPAGLDALLAPATQPPRPARGWLLAALAAFLAAVLLDCGGVFLRIPSRRSRTS